MEFLGSSKLLLAHLVSTAAIIVMLLVQSWGKRNGNSTSQNVIELIVLAEIKPFFLNKHSLGCFETLINFQSSENIDCDHFFQCSYCF